MWHLWLCVDDGMLLPARMLDVEEILVKTLNEYQPCLPRDGRTTYSGNASSLVNDILETTRMFLFFGRRPKAHRHSDVLLARDGRKKGPVAVTSRRRRGTACGPCAWAQQRHAEYLAGICSVQRRRAARRSITRSAGVGWEPQGLQMPDWKYRYMDGRKSTRHSDTWSGVWRKAGGRASSGSDTRGWSRGGPGQTFVSVALEGGSRWGYSDVDHRDAPPWSVTGRGVRQAAAASSVCCACWQGTAV
ncbi:hypothetical protein CMUS01_15843 [Colletotrichum musicola]|uniref:Uncharacterized protein n=1 Tax=Colletotrichum musicola TaxID=2175873 RepID=A0A8H6MLG9_9PEZI|nr:hypothetical protein CMUS01_15843 [Colletotrichum musicola]